MECKVLAALEEEFILVRTELARIDMGYKSANTQGQLEDDANRILCEIMTHKSEHGCLH